MAPKMPAVVKPGVLFSGFDQNTTPVFRKLVCGFVLILVNGL